ncbi:sulfatase [Haloglomus salinum]|uniref:sulfatase n=1 Tax=Haloglomus salinum TaxID=2962673 RepID=UPI0020C95127|nr:sulfatase [Haloglomus salinum]
MDSRPNVVWVTLDSVRQDRTTMGGHDRDTTPRLQHMAGAGRSFSTCIAAGIWTLPSSASILTGTYPSHNTVGVDGETIPPELPTVAERFSDAGYRTACLSRNGHLSGATGMDRGFDRFEWIAASTLLSAAGPRTLAKYLLNIRRHSAGLTTDTAKHATPFLMNDIAKRWLDDLAGEEPFFYYLHYNEPHRPFVPPLPWQDRYTSDIDATAEEAIDIAMDAHRNMHARVASGDPLTDREREALLAMYDAEVAYTDECVGRLHDRVRGLDTDRETVFVVTADHGEMLGDRGLLAHNLVVDDALVNVPLVASGLDDLAVEDDDLVQHTDLMRTLLEAAGADTDRVQGIDLREEGREFAISQRGPANFDLYLDHDATFDTSRFHESLLTGLRTETHRYQRSEDRTELLALPGETTDVSESEPELAAELEARLDEWLATEGKPVGEGRDAEFDDAMRRQLSDLGYVE